MSFYFNIIIEQPITLQWTFEQQKRGTQINNQI